MRKKHVNALSLLLLILAVVITIYFIYGAINIKKLEREERELKKRKLELEAIRDELLLKYDSVNTKEYMENEARSKLKLVRPEEIIIIYAPSKE